MDPGAIYSDDRLGFAEKLWITREYGLGGIWIRGEATVRSSKSGILSALNYVDTIQTTCRDISRSSEIREYLSQK